MADKANGPAETSAHGAEFEIRAGRSDKAPAASPAEFDAALFRALHAMAIKSPRFQADVQAAMRHAHLTAHPARLAASLQRLEVAGQVSNLIPLSDGGLLITVAV